MADERTDLAWNRCGLALVAGGLVIMRGLTVGHFSRRDVAVGAVILGLGMVSYLSPAGTRDAGSHRTGARDRRRRRTCFPSPCL